MFVNMILTFVITALALFILSKIPGLGIEIDGFNKLLISALVFGFLNAAAQLLRVPLAAGPLEWLTWPLLMLINVLVFAAAAKLVHGFRLTNGWISAALGSVALTFIYHIVEFAAKTAI